MRNDFTEVLKCQSCLQDLILQENRLICTNCKKEYQILRDLIFMGYNKNDKSEIDKIISTESAHQTDLSEIHKQTDFAYSSIKIGMATIRTLRKDLPESDTMPIAIDVGSGGAPTSKMLAESGFDTYRCELDPNSLYLGLAWKNDSPQACKNIVCDCTYLPFSNNSVDVVYCKEIVHHILDYKSFFNEINRVLKPGGVFVMIEPTNILTIKNVDDHFGHHYQTINKYIKALKENNLKPYRYNLFYYFFSRRIKFLNVLKRQFNKENYSYKKTSGVCIYLKKIIQNLIGGSNVLFCRKTGDSKCYIDRPEFINVEPDKLVIEESFLSDTRLNIIKGLFDKVSDEFKLI